MRAQIWCGVLREHDIEAEVWHECTPFIYGPQPVFGSVLAVPENQWETAQSILAQKPPLQAEGEDDTPRDEAKSWSRLPDILSVVMVAGPFTAALAVLDVLASALNPALPETGLVERVLEAAGYSVMIVVPAALIGAVAGAIVWVGLQPLKIIWRYTGLQRALIAVLLLFLAGAEVGLITVIFRLLDR